ncbi:P-loop containing nucleoside triphosphate hydrolase protein [Lipomyces arxii]|uniref:P-loop containing nucleoside triphosphate hydrolase protein n=1 Tax=Lipomyces arxii TaxID=56418 RepID=UPI0034CFE470
MAKGDKKGIISTGNSGTAKTKPVSPASSLVKQSPTAKSIVAASSSWTGKLPATLLHEHVHKLGWEKVNYDMKHSPGGFTATAVLGLRNPKTSLIETVRLTPPEQLLPPQPTALEARHFAATYALHRIASHKNMAMVLPGDHKSLWRKLEDKRRADIKVGHAADYSSDPFMVQRERADAKAASMAAREARQAQAAKIGGTETSSGRVFANRPKNGWDSVPVAEMARNTRTAVEKCIRKYHAWELTTSHTGLEQEIIDRLVGLGFRTSHVQEAASYVSTEEAALEWLLIYVPEDDLPAIFLPENYTPGVSLVTSSLAVEYAVKRITQAGYPADLARDTVKLADDNEVKAIERLTFALIHPDTIMPEYEMPSDQDVIWEEERETLAAIYDDRFKSELLFLFEIKLETPEYCGIALRFHKSTAYPNQIPSLSLVHTSNKRVLPAYLRLSAARKAAEYAETILGEQMCFTIVEWMQENLHEFVNEPVKLKSLAGAVYGVSYFGDTVELGTDSVTRQRRTQRRRDQHSKLGSAAVLSEFKSNLEREAVKAMIKIRQTLPAWEKQAEIVQKVNANQVTLITGETGSGKSTQSVQFVLDDMILRGQGGVANLLCTQPRRISAMGLAARVADERGGAVGDQVGYVIRGESKTSARTQIRFMTTGVLLRMLQTDPRVMTDVSHVFIDEVHERTLDSDFLLIILKRLCKANKQIKVVLMSATVNANMFMSYFDTKSHVDIEGRTFPVQDLYVDDILRQTGFRPSLPPSNNEEDDEVSRYVSALGGRIDYDLLAATVRQIDAELGDKDGSILVFLPGTAEISRCISAISALSSKYTCFPLHAGLIPADQRKVFGKVASPRRKVVAATNIAETSITIPDVVAVIDTGRVKETEFDPMSKMTRLVEKWVSRAAAKQRRGRAGRVSSGKCYKMYTRSAEEKAMPLSQIPEIARTPLEQLYLSVKAMNVADAAGFLAEAIDPPDGLSVEAARTTLVAVGGLDEDTDKLTALGRHMSSIPTDLKCAKLMVYGAIFGCLDVAVVAAGVLVVRSPFMSANRDLSKQKREQFGAGNGDVIADVRAFVEWERKIKESGYKVARSWCDEQCLSMKTMEDIASTRDQYLSALQEIGFIETTKIVYNTVDYTLSRALIAAAMTPSLVRIQFPETKYQQLSSGAVALEHEAKSIKLFSQDDGRVFIHPSSTLFSSQSFVGGSEFVAYFHKMATSKIFIRELTPFTTYGLLMFGGELGTDLHGRGVVVGNYFRLRCWPRIGVLIGRMRMLLDSVLKLKAEDPRMDVSTHEVVKVVRRLIESDGM